MKRLLFLCLINSVCILCQADDILDGITYRTDMLNKTASVERASVYMYGGEIVVPETVHFNGQDFVVTTIEHHAFSGTHFNSISLPKGITEISNDAFSGCYELESINIPAKIKEIHKETFYGCSKLKSINIPEGVEKIDEYAFYNCNSLYEVNIGSMKQWCNIIFADEYSNPAYYSHSITINGEKSSKLLIPEDTEYIHDYSFCGCSDYTEIIIPKNVKRIGDFAFSGCSGIEFIKLPSTLSAMDANAFSGCSKLKEISIPEKVKHLSEGIFAGCTSLVSVTLPQNLERIYDYAFYDCYRLKDIRIPEVVSKIGTYAFYNCGIESITIPDLVTEIEERTFAECHSLKDVTLSNNLRRIGNYAFYNSGIESLEIPSSVTYYGTEALNCGVKHISFAEGTTQIKRTYAKRVESVSLPETTVSIESMAFYNCSSLTEIVIPNSVATIKNSAFLYCSNLTKVDVGSGISSFGTDVFKKCSALKTMICRATKLPVTDNNIFDGSGYMKGVLYVLPDLVGQYKSVNPWYGWGMIGSAEDVPTNVIATKHSMSITSNDGIVKISGLSDGEKIEAYTVDGKLINITYTSSTTATILAKPNEVVVVLKIANETKKIIVK